MTVIPIRKGRRNDELGRGSCLNGKHIEGSKKEIRKKGREGSRFLQLTTIWNLQGTSVVEVLTWSVFELVY